MKKTIFGALVATTALLSACDGGTPIKPSLNDEVDSLSYVLGVANSPSEEQVKEYLVSSGADSAYADAFIKGLKDGLSVSDDKKDLAYQLGMQSGLNIKMRMFPGVESQAFAGDSTRHVSTKQFVAGFLDGYKNKEGKTGLIVGKDTISRQNVQNYLMGLMERLSKASNEKLYGESKKKNKEFMVAKLKEAGVQKLDGGVGYKVIKSGNGATPKSDQTVEVKYEGRLIDGTVFDSSQDDAISFPCNGVIKGWTTALTNMKEGDEWEVYIPYDQAYGDVAQGKIPPYSTLIFKMTLVKVKNETNRF